jgi:opacity protein-like surface antigen
LAAQPGESTRENFGRGKQSISITSGYGMGLQLRDSTVGKDVTKVRFVPLSLVWGMGLWEPLAGDSWLRGSLDATVEGTVVMNTEPDFGVGGGAVLGFRYDFLALGRLVPYVEAGAGVGGVDWNLEWQADGFIFFLQAGAGAHYRVGESWGLVGSWRYQHLSNAYTQRPNRGIDASVWSIGITRFLD